MTTKIGPGTRGSTRERVVATAAARPVRRCRRAIVLHHDVLATGGGAFVNADTRAAIAAKGISVWLKAEFDVLMRRIRRRQDRPLLKTDDPAATLQELIAQRYPVYGLADRTVQSREVPHERIVEEIVSELAQHLGLGRESAAAPAPGDRAS